MLNIEKIIYIYIFVCFSVIAFNIGYVIHLQKENKREENMRAWIKSILPNELNGVHTHRTQLMKRLRNIDFFSVFSDELLILEEAQRNQYLMQNANLFNQVVRFYENKENIIQAGFAYHISRLQLLDYMDERIHKLLMTLISSPYPYCRQNALLAFYHCHNPQFIIKAILILNREDIYHYDKLIIDGVLHYLGDKEGLANELLLIYPHLNESYRIIVINILKGVPVNYSEEVYALYEYGTQTLDIQIAIIRYFSRWHYPPFEPILFEILNDSSLEWELRSVCAFCLRNYPSSKSESLLKECLHDFNWYIRYNAAESLLSMKQGIDTNEIADSYGQDMMAYMRQRIQLQRGDQ